MKVEDVVNAVLKREKNGHYVIQQLESLLFEMMKYAKIHD